MRLSFDRYLKKAQTKTNRFWNVQPKYRSISCALIFLGVNSHDLTLSINAIFSSEKEKNAYQKKFGSSGIDDLNTIQKKLSQLGLGLKYRPETNDFVVLKSSKFSDDMIKKALCHEYAGVRTPQLKKTKDTKGNFIICFICNVKSKQGLIDPIDSGWGSIF